MIDTLRKMSNNELADVLIQMLVDGDEAVHKAFTKLTAPMVNFTLTHANSIVEFDITEKDYEKLKTVAPQFVMSKIEFIKEIRRLTGLGLLEAKLLAEQGFGKLVNYTTN